jgi:hypothetical protein
MSFPTATKLIENLEAQARHIDRRLRHEGVRLAQFRARLAASEE